MKKCTIPLSVAMLAIAATPCLADRIDGHWCSPSGMSIFVDGPNVTSPGGRAVKANYDRHHVDFVIPHGEPGAGQQFFADQLNHHQISVLIRPQDNDVAGSPEIWTPCEPVS